MQNCLCTWALVPILLTRAILLLEFYIMQHIVTLQHLGNEFYLRSTIWTADRNRATIFQSEDAARAGLAKAKQFMKAAQFKAARIVAVQS